MTHPYDMSYDAPPHSFSLFINNLFFRLLMILELPKNPQSGRACAPGGSAPAGSWRPPALGTGCGVFGIGREAPLGGERPIVCATSMQQHGTGWGGSGKEGKDLGKNSGYAIAVNERRR